MPFNRFKPLASAGLLLTLVLTACPTLQAQTDFLIGKRAVNLLDTVNKKRLTPVLPAVVGSAVHISLSASDLGFNPHLSTFQWSFGDAAGSYNVLEGFNAAHVYETPGIYPIRVNGAVYAQANVRPLSMASMPVDGPTDLRAVLAAGGTAQLPPGATLIDETLVAAPGARLVGSPAGSSRLIWTGAPRQAMLVGWSGGLTVRDVTFASTYTNSFEKDAPDAIRLSGSNNTILRCRFADITTAVNGNGRPDGTLVQDCVVDGDGDLRGYLVWAEGRRWTILGNRVPNSTRETPVRLAAVGNAPNCQFALVAYNSLANIDRPGIDPADAVKAAIKCESVDFAWVAHNQFDGIAEAGPLGEADGFPSRDRRANYMVWSNNVHRGPARLKHGLVHFTLQDSRIDYLAGTIGGNVIAVGIEGYNPQFDRASSDLTIRRNVLTTPRHGERQIWVTGEVRDGLKFANNTLVQGTTLTANPAKASIALEGGWMPGYSSQSNTFPAAGGLGWPNPLAVAQVGGQNDVGSYLVAPQWLQLPSVAGDRFVDVPAP